MRVQRPPAPVVTARRPAGLAWHRRTILRVRLGSFQEFALTSSGACHPTIHRPSRPAPSRWPRWATWPATCGGPGTRRPRTSSPRSTPSCGSRPGATRSACSAPSAGRGSRSWPRDAGLPASGSAPPSADLDGATSPSDRWYQRKAGGDGADARSATSRPSSASPRCCRSTPAASASSPATTSRPPATSACRSSASACSTGTATSSSRSPARAGSRRPTRSSTPTGCRSRCCARPTAPRATISIDHARRARPARPDLGRAASAGCRCCCSTPTSRATPTTTRRHRPALRRQQRAPAAPGAAARRRRRPRAARLLAGSPVHPAPEVFHTNEGHAGFLGLERIRELTVDEDGPQLDFDTALEVGRASTVFTTHTPVPGRHRPLPARAGRAVLRRRPAPRPASRSTGSSRSAPRTTTAATPTVFNMAVMGFRLAQRANGVSQLHGHVSREHVQRPVAGLRRGRGADRLDHQRRARPDLGRPARSSSSPPRQGADTDADDADAFWAAVDQVAGRRDLGGQAAAARAARRRRPPPAAQARGRKRGAAKAELGWIDERARPRRADDRLRAPRAVVQAADADAARPRAAQAPAARTPSARSSWSSPARRTRPTTAARS